MHFVTQFKTPNEVEKQNVSSSMYRPATSTTVISEMFGLITHLVDRYFRIVPCYVICGLSKIQPDRFRCEVRPPLKSGCSFVA